MKLADLKLTELTGKEFRWVEDGDLGVKVVVWPGQVHVGVWGKSNGEWRHELCWVVKTGGDVILSWWSSRSGAGWQEACLTARALATAAMVGEALEKM